MNKNDIEAIYTLSSMQEGMLFHTLYAPKSRVYFEQTVYALYGQLNIPAFKLAWQKVIERQPILRTLFLWEGHEKPLQVVRKQVKLPWVQQDWRTLSPDEQQKRLDIFLEEDQIRGFKVSQAPLLRLALIQTANDTHYFVQSFHHLLLDRWSFSLVIKEVFAYYEAFHQGQDLYLKPCRPYRDYIAWLRQQDLSRSEEFWRETLKGFTAPTTLGIDRAPGTRLTDESNYENQQIRLSVTTTSALQSLGRAHRLTLNTLVQAAWALLLSRYSGEEDVMFGATVSGRPAALPGVESMVGLLINTLPVRVQVSHGDLMLPWLKRLQEKAIEVRHYEHSPLVEVQKWSEVPKRLPLFETILVFENIWVDGLTQEQIGNLEVRHVRSDGSRTNYPLAVIALPGRELGLRIVYERSRFDNDAITRMLGHFETLLKSIVADLDRRLSDLPLLTEAEGHQLLVEWNNTEADYPKDKCIHELFEEQVERTPDAIAVEFDNQRLTYWELNRRANQLAHYLRKRSVGPETLVAICMERSIEMLVGLLGILKAGGAYVPLDPAYPKERLAFMLEDAQVAVLVTQRQCMTALPAQAIPVVCLDTNREHIAQQSTANPSSGVIPENLAYVMYTSGSTGIPKGVMVEHRQVLAFLHGFEHVAPGGEGGIGTAVCPFSFDVSVWEYFSMLCFGGTLHLVPLDIVTAPEKFVHYLVEHGITSTYIPPPLLADITSQLEQQQAQTALTRLLVGVEPIPQGTLQRLRDLSPWMHIVNSYGPTETTICATLFLFHSATEPDRRTPIGTRINGYEVYLVDANQQPVPVGVVGELHIGGVALARGYLNRPELTAEKFIANPFSSVPGARLYKTGDLARYLPDGNIEFLGRLDHQVKIRGFRIELGEVEAVLSQHPAVRETVVMVREDGDPSASLKTDRRLVAYVVASQQHSHPVGELRSFLQAKLPDYMVPSVFVFLDSLPLTANGKVDRRALPAPDQNRPELEESFVAPRNAIEETLAGIWAEVLKLNRVGIHDNFFDLGGHSLLATQLVSRIREALEIDLPLRTLFERSTVVSLSEEIEMIRWVGKENPQTSSGGLGETEEIKL